MGIAASIKFTSPETLALYELIEDLRTRVTSLEAEVMALKLANELASKPPFAGAQVAPTKEAPRPINLAAAAQANIYAALATLREPEPVCCCPFPRTTCPACTHACLACATARGDCQQMPGEKP